MILPIHLYGLLIGAGVVAAVEVAEKVALGKNIDKKIIWEAAIWIVMGGIMGARLYHVIDYWNRWYGLHPVEALYIWQGGLGIWGAIIGGLLGLLGYYFLILRNKNKDLGFWKLLDTVIVGLPLAQAIGRLGNGVNREVYGTVTNLPWGIYISEENSYRHPLFAYEAILDLILFTLLWRLRKSKLGAGKISGIYFIGYGVIRALLENFRPAEIVWRIGGIPTAILFSLLAIVSGIYLISSRRK